MVGNVNTFVNSQPRDFAEVVVRVSPDRANTIGTEGDSFWILMIQFLEFCFAREHETNQLELGKKYKQSKDMTHEYIYPYLLHY